MGREGSKSTEYRAYQSREGKEIIFPVGTVTGAYPGPHLVVTGGIHGAEYPGIVEAGGIGQLEESAVNLHMRGLYNVLRFMKILPGEAVTAEAVREYPNFVWLHTPEKGFYVSCVKAGSCS